MTFTILPNATRQPGTYRSPAVTIPAGKMFRMYLTGIDLSQEPSTVFIEWSIETSTDGGQTWVLAVKGDIRGNEGTPYYKVPVVAVSIHDMAGQLATGYLTINTRLKFGIDGEVT